MAIMINHHLLAVAFGVLGNIISFFVFLAPIPTFYRIFKKKSTESFKCIPYLVALFSSMLWLYYALIKGGAFLLITINSFGCCIETIYIVMFLAYAPTDKRNSALKVLLSMNLGAFSLILVVTHFVLKGNLQIVVLGWICVGFSVSVFAAPLSIMALVIKTKSVEFMPFTLSFFLTMSAVMWFGYGLFLRDIWIALPNVIGFVLGLVQMMLYVFYKYAREVEKVADETDLSELPVKNNVIFKEVDSDETKEDAPEEEHRDQPKNQEKSFEISNAIQQDDSPV